MPGTRNTKIRAARQETLRELLSSQGHLQHINDIVGKIGDEDLKIEQEMVNRYKIVIDTKLKLLAKYLPDLKAVEMQADILHKPHEDWLKILASDDE